MRTKSLGFTLVEVLVISPIVILFIGTFIALLVNLTGESLVMREKNIAIYDSQAAQDDIQDNLSQATGFLTTTGPLQSPQGKDNGTAPFVADGGTNPDALILMLAATDKSPTDSTRSLIYTGAGACDSKNPIYMYYVVYFVGPDPDAANSTALFKRTILPNVAACADPWQRGSCEATRPKSSLCERRDEKLVGGVKTFDVQYFAGTAPATAGTATDVSATIGVQKSVAGSTVDYGSGLKATSLNVQPSEGGGTPGTPPPPPANPAITVFRNPSNPYPYQTKISWTRIGNATGYRARYTLGGGAVQTVNLPQTGSNPSFDINASHRKQAIVLTEVKVLTSSGEVDYGTLPTISPIPSWNSCNFQNGWDDYIDYYGGGPFTRAGYTRTSSGIIGLKGLVKGTTLNVPICNLPEGFRPKFAGEKLIFQTAACCSNWGRIDIYANGDVVPVQGNTEWFSLDGIMFLADTAGTTLPTTNWTNRVWEYGWSNYGGGHSTLRSTTDSQGRVHIQGLGSYPGTSPNGNVMTNVGTGPSRMLHVPAMSGGPGIVQVNTSGWVLVRSSPNSYQQIQLMYRPGGAAGWQNMPFSSGWGNYDVNNWPTMQCHRGSDDVVIVQGLIAHNDPADGNGTYIGDTGPCGAFNGGDGQNRMILSPWMSNETTGRIDMINGVSLLSQGTQDPWTSLDGIHFIAD